MSYFCDCRMWPCHISVPLGRSKALFITGAYPSLSPPLCVMYVRGVCIGYFPPSCNTFLPVLHLFHFLHPPQFCFVLALSWCIWYTACHNVLLFFSPACVLSVIICVKPWCMSYPLIATLHPSKEHVFLTPLFFPASLVRDVSLCLRLSLSLGAGCDWILTLSGAS